MQTFEVVIIGGGIVGSSIAWHLTASGCGKVLVIERESAFPVLALSNSVENTVKTPLAPETSG